MINVTFGETKGDLLKLQKQQQNLFFAGRRNDRNRVKELTDEKGESLYINKELKIQEAIERLAKDSSSDNIKFLLGVAENLQYGTRSGSLLHRFLTTESDIANKLKLSEVTKESVEAGIQPSGAHSGWEELLKKAVSEALSNNNTFDKANLEKEFERVFSKKQKETKVEIPSSVWISQSPHSKQARELRELIRLRNEIVNSGEFLKSPDLKNKKEAREFLDKFLASSEISVYEKGECLKLFSNFFSNNYKINPQLTNYKVQILSEILQDVVGVNLNISQGDRGECAAASTSIQAMSDQYKLQYVTNLLNAFDDKPVMELIDITAPNKTDKITCVKADIDYTTEIGSGYRVVDAAISNFMNIADQTVAGNQFKKYNCSNNDYGILRDDHLYAIKDPKYLPRIELLRTLIKLNDVIEKIEEQKVEQKQAKEELNNPNLISVKAICKANTIKVLESLTKQEGLKCSEDKLNDVALKLMYTQEIDSREGPDTKKSRLLDIIKAELPSLQATSSDKSIDEIFEQYTSMEAISSEEKDLTKKLSLNTKGMYDFYHNLFKLAAFERVSREKEVEVPERLETFANKFGVEKEKAAVLKEMEKRNIILPRATLNKMYAEFEKVSKYKRLDINYGDKDFIPEQKLYALSKNTRDILKAVGSNFSDIRRDVIRNYKSLNKELDSQLNELALKDSRGTGHLWIGEECGSGLSTPQYGQLASKLSGKDYYIEEDAKKALDHIENGKRNNASSTMVDDSEFSAHAMHVRRVVRKPIFNPVTKKVENQRVLDHINTWGKAAFKKTNSKKAYWQSDDKTDRTDYLSHSGGKNGYVLDKKLGTNGVPEIELLTSTGMNKPHLIGTPLARIKRGVGEKYPMFMTMTLEGEDRYAHGNSQARFKDLIKMHNNEAETQVEDFFNRMLEGNRKQVDKFVDKLIAKIYTDALEAMNQKDKLKTLSKKIESDVIDLMNKYPSIIFRPGTAEQLSAEFATEIPKMVKSKINSKGSKTEKETAIADFIESMVIDGVYANAILAAPLKQNLKDKGEENEISYKADKLSTQLTRFAETIKTRQEYDALPESHPLKITLNKIVMKDFANTDAETDTVDKAETEEDLRRARNFLIHKHKKPFYIVFNKTPLAMDIISGDLKEDTNKVIKELEVQNNIDLSKVKSKIKESVIQNNGSSTELKEQMLSIINEALNLYHNSSEYKDSIEEQLKTKLNEVVDTTLKNAVGIKSAADLEKYSEDIVNWIDSKFNPSSDEEFMNAVDKLYNMNKAEFKKLLNESSEEELGIVFDDPFILLERLRGLHHKAESDFENQVFEDLYQKLYIKKIYGNADKIKEEHNKWLKTPQAAQLTQEEKDARLVRNISNFYLEKIYEDSEDLNDYQTWHADWLKTPQARIFSDYEKEEKLSSYLENLFSEDPTDIDATYKKFNSLLSYINLEKFIKNQKQEALDKYGARPGFPILKPYTDQEIKESVAGNILLLANSGAQLSVLKSLEQQNAGHPRKLREIRTQIDATVDNIKNTSTIVVRGIIRPKHQGKVMSMINDWIKAFSKNPQSETANEKLVQLEQQMIKDYITNYPTELLEHIVKEVPKMVSNKPNLSEVETEILDLWSKSLTDCINTARKAKLEYGIMDDISDLRMPQVAKLLRDPKEESISMEDSVTGKNITFPLDSKEGIEFILDTFDDPTNNNSTLKYFIETTGLTKTAINYLLSGIKPSKSANKVKQLINNLELLKTNQAVIQDKFEEFTDKMFANSDKMVLSELERTIKDLNNQLSTLNIKPEMVEDYKKRLNDNLVAAEQMGKVMLNPRSDARELLLEWQGEILDDQRTEIMKQIKVELEFIKLRSRDIETLRELIPDHSELKPQIDEVILETQKFWEEVSPLVFEQLISEPMKKANELTAEAKQSLEQMAQQVKEHPENVEIELQMFPEKIEDNATAKVIAHKLIKAINNKNLAEISSISNYLVHHLQEGNKILNDTLSKALKTVEDEDFSKVIVSVSAQSGNMKPAVWYVNKILDKNEQLDAKMQNNKDLLKIVEYLMDNPFNADGNPNEEIKKVMARLFKACCIGSKNPGDENKALLGMLFADLPSKGVMFEDKLIQTIFDPDANSKQKDGAIDLLGRINTIVYFNLFKDILEKPQKVATDASYKLFLMRQAIKSVNRMAQRGSNLPYNKILNLPTLQLNELVQMANQAKAEDHYPLEEVDALVKAIVNEVDKLKRFQGSEKLD